MTNELGGALVAAELLALLGGVALAVRLAYQGRQAARRAEEDTAFVRQEVTHAYRQVESLLALEKLLNLSQPLPPLRGWAASPDFLRVVAEHILLARPACVMECSSGSSTLVAARCLQLNGAGHVYSLEHSSEYAEITRANLRRHGLQDWATVIDAPLVPYAEFDGARWYSLEGAGVVSAPVEMLIVDGPPLQTARLARFPALPALASRLASRSTLFLDDADREQEQAIVAAWKQSDPNLVVDKLECEKGCVRIRRGVV